MFRGDRSKQSGTAGGSGLSSMPSPSPSRSKDVFGSPGIFQSERSFGNERGTTARDNVSPVMMEPEEVSLPAVEMFFRNLDLEDQDDVKHGKDEDSDWEEDDDEDDDDDDEGLDGATGGMDTRGEDRDLLDGEGSKKDADENRDDDELGAGEDISLSGVNESVLPTTGGPRGSMGAASGFASTFKKIGVFVKRELNKRKTGGGSKRTMAKVQLRKKETQELTGVHCVQKLAMHSGPIWVMECSPASGLYLATGGKDGKIVVWEMITESIGGQQSGGERHSASVGADISRAETSSAASNSTPSPSSSAAAAQHLPFSLKPSSPSSSSSPTKQQQTTTQPQQAPTPDDQDVVAGVIVTGPSVFKPQPYRVYVGHTSDVISISWSKSLFLASGSTDKTCRIWHISSESCLSILKHPDFVPAVDFHPLDDSLLLTGCFDKKLRFWDVAQGAVSQRVQCQSFITACRFNQSGDMAVAGLYTGHCVFYQMAPYGYGKAVTAGMKYYTQIECRNKTGMQKKGRKVTSLRFITVRDDKQIDSQPQEYMLVTTNESRSRLYSMDDFSLVRKYRGATNSSMLQIGATCSEDGRHIICGSEDRSLVVWRLKNDLVKTIFGGQGRRDMCDTYEAFHACSSGPVTAASFAPDQFIRARKARLNPPTASPGSVSQDQQDTSPKLVSSLQSSSNAAHGDESSSDLGLGRGGLQAKPRDTMDLDRATDSASSGVSPIGLQAEDDVGLGGSVILAAGFDGVVGVFEVST